MNPEIVSTTVDGKPDLFGHEGQAKMYFEFRPKYPEVLAKHVISLVPSERRNMYVDIACGSGQLTNLIAPSFRQSVGLDQSISQLSEAITVEGLEFKAGSAFALPFPEASVDLITVAQALHWLVPYERFFAEVDRVLKPGGVFVTAAYAFPQLVKKEANDVVKAFYIDLLGGHLSPGQPGCWWETNRPTIDGFYADILYPYPTKLEKFPVLRSVPVKDYVNYLRTLSAYRTLLRAGHADPLPQLESDLENYVSGEDHVLDLEIPFFVVELCKQ